MKRQTIPGKRNTNTEHEYSLFVFLIGIPYSLFPLFSGIGAHCAEMSFRIAGDD